MRRIIFKKLRSVNASVLNFDIRFWSRLPYGRSSSSVFPPPTLLSRGEKIAEIYSSGSVCNDRNSSTSTFFPAFSTQGAILNGDDCYEKALEANRRKNALEDEIEQRASMDQFQAMERTREKAMVKKKIPTDRTAGVAVVRTITKQARKKDDTMRTTSVGSDRAKEQNTTPEDWEREQMKWLERAAYEFGHPKALIRLGNHCLVEAKQSAGTVEKGKRKIRESVESENDDDDGSVFHDLNLVSPDELLRLSGTLNLAQKAAYLYKLAGQTKQSPEGWFNLGHLLWTGFPDQTEDGGYDANAPILLQRNILAAQSAFEEAIRLGDADAMFFMGVHLLSIEVDDQITISGNHSDEQQRQRRERGLRLIQESSSPEHEHGGAMHYLALLHRNGDKSLGLEACTPADFRLMLDRAADVGKNPEAVFLRAHCLFTGADGYERDLSKALKGFEDAADAGHADAAVSAGAVHYHHRQDHRRAFEWYQVAAELGSQDGWRNLVRCYALGEGVPQNEQTARYIANTMLRDDDKNTEDGNCD